ncbi:MAG TPA: DUF2069 domain-containing protein [Rhodocyclaceae bacterium]|jgi:uncharacterized membrane protein|nr:DUF2069 domain-containing protein [Rhodocyclaceae bacterium]
MQEQKASATATSHSAQCSTNVRRLNLASSSTLITLILLCTAWELWLAPLRPGGSMLVLKTLPLLAALFGILRGKRYTHQWMSMLILAYFTEGIVRATSEGGMAQTLAIIEIALTVVFFLSAIYYAKLTRPASSGA